MLNILPSSNPLLPVLVVLLLVSAAHVRRMLRD